MTTTPSQPYNPWREFVENCISGDNYFRASEYREILDDIDGLTAERDHHTLIRHGCEVLEDAPRTYNALASYLANKDIEGVVWHHPDGRMVKIKGKDFGLKRGRLVNEGTTVGNAMDNDSNHGFWDRPADERAERMRNAAERGGAENFFDLPPEDRARAYEGSRDE